MFVRFAAGLLLVALSCHSMAASFDCTKASNFAEKEICRDGYLSTVDGVLARTYKEAMAATDQPEALRQSQREWLTIRNQCTTQKCLDKALGGRIQSLEAFISAEKKKAYERAHEQRIAELRAQEAERTRQQEAAFARQEQERQLRTQAAQQAALAQRPAVSTQVAPSYPAATVQPIQGQQSPVSPAVQANSVWQDVFSVLWKLALIVAVIASGWALWLHHKGQATIYNDYTDAAITNLLPVTGLIIGLLCGWLGLPHQVYQVAVITGILSAVAFAVYAAAMTNDGALNITLTLIAKLTFVSVFYLVMGLLILSLFGGARRKGESRAQAEARQRREARQTRAQIAATSAGYTFFTAWLCRRAEFTSLSECLEFSSEPQAV